VVITDDAGGAPSVGCRARRGRRGTDRHSYRSHQYGQVRIEGEQWVSDSVRAFTDHGSKCRRGDQCAMGNGKTGQRGYAALIDGDNSMKIVMTIRRIALTNTEETFSVAFSLIEVHETVHFIAREEELSGIHKTLGGDGNRQTVVLHGLGGIGKTQLTVAYAKRHKADYSAIFWLNGKDEGSLKQSFARVARRILQDHPSASRLSAVKEDSSLDEMVAAVKRWLDHPKNTRWLIIYDNYDNPRLRSNTDPTAVDLRGFLPEADHGSVIITTRSSQVKLGHRIKVGKLEDMRDSLEILSHTSGRGNAVDGEIDLR
jgi:hypothetical protein